jgi:protocatechuate 3,4-dioxygenase, beta subunit
MGRVFDERLVTQMYFPSDPLFPYDPIFNSVRDPDLQQLMVSRFSIDASQDNWALAYEFDIVVDATPVEGR